MTAMGNSELVMLEDIVNDKFQVRFEPSRRKTVKKMFVTLSGDFIIDHVQLIYSAVFPVLLAYPHVTIKLIEIKKIDLAAIQVLHVFSVINKNLITDSSGLDSSHKQLISTAGLTDIVERSRPLETE